MYKQASKMKLRFATSKGNLSVEDLWVRENGKYVRR